MALTLGLAPFSTDAVRARAIVAYFAPTDLRQISERARDYCRPVTIPDEQSARASISPVALVTANSPPTLLLTGDEDRVVPIRHSEALLAHAAAVWGRPGPRDIFGHGAWDMVRGSRSI